jgi:hypothetical protein
MISILSRSKSASLSSVAGEDQPYSSRGTLRRPASITATTKEVPHYNEHYDDAAVKQGKANLFCTNHDS